MTLTDALALGPTAVFLYGLGFMGGVALFLLVGRWLAAKTVAWHPVTRWLALGLLSLTLAVLANAGIVEPVAQWVHITLNLDGKH